MPIDAYKLSQLAQEWDPTPFLQATEGGAMDMFGSAASPMQAGNAMQTGAPYASIFKPQTPGAMPGGSPLPPQMMQQFMPQQQPVHPAPASAPRQPGMIQFPGTTLPEGLKPVPSLAQLLKGGV